MNKSKYKQPRKVKTGKYVVLK